MSSLQRTLEDPDDRSQGLQEPRCPICDQPIAHEQVARVRERIEAQERRQARETEALLTRERAAFEVKATTRIAAIEEAHAAQLVVACEEATKTANAVTASELSEAEQGKKAAEEQLSEVKANQEADLSLRLVEQREALEQDKV